MLKYPPGEHMSIETGASARQQETPQIPMSRRRLWGQWFAYVTGPEHVTASLRVLAAGFSIGLCAWESAHAGLLENYLLKNELNSVARQGLVRWLVVSCLVVFAGWLAGSLWVAGTRRSSIESALRRGANFLFCALPLALIPVLALPQFEIRHPLLNLTLVTCLAATLLLQSQVVARDWSMTATR
jgi:hypothetical protein